MKLDIFIKQTKLETSILVELDGVKQFSMRKILGTFPDDVVKALISLLIDVTIYNPIKHINIYCANRGLFLFLNKKGKDSNLVYLDYLLGGYDSVIINKKVNEIDYKFDDFMISIGSYKQESAILEETLDSTIFHKKYAMPSNETSYHLWIAQLLQMFLKKKRKTLKRVTTDIYVMLDDNYVCDRLKQLLLSNKNSDKKRRNANTEISQILLECACILNELQATVIFVPRYQNKACQYCKEGVHV